MGAMPLDDVVRPDATAVVTSELQNGVVGERSALPALAVAARPAVLAAGRLVKAARAAGVTVVHGTVYRRPDGRGANRNARLFAAVRRSPVGLAPGTPEVEVVPEVGVEPDDLVLTRSHGLSPMAGTALDPVLRNLQVSTVVVVGVSVNVAVTNLVMDAVNHGYQVVVPRDAVAGVPEDYAAAVIDNTLALLATLTTVEALVGIWARAGTPGGAGGAAGG
jgi:nicotinamidase-related amidase